MGLNRNGSPCNYGYDRCLLDEASGKIERRLQAGERVRMQGFKTRLVPSADPARIQAVQCTFERFTSSDIGCLQLALELESRGFPSPTDMGWLPPTVRGILRNPVYCGGQRWAASSGGVYHTVQGEEIVPIAKKGRRGLLKPPEDSILVDGTHKPLVSVAVWKRAQKKFLKRQKRRTGTRTMQPLAGLVVCGHCGKAMYGKTIQRNNRKGKAVYSYEQYVCRSYHRIGHANPSGCGHHTVKADLVLRWLIQALQQVFLGRARENLVVEIKKELQAERKSGKTDTRRLEKRLSELDREIPRLVKAIRTTDVPELVAELADCRNEWDRLRADLDRIRKQNAPTDIDAEAVEIADQVWTLGESLTEAVPSLLRELLQSVVSRIVCCWQHSKTKAGRTRCKLVGGEVHLRDNELVSCLFPDVAHAVASI